jgi:hypothetical protein
MVFLQIRQRTAVYKIAVYSNSIGGVNSMSTVVASVKTLLDFILHYGVRYYIRSTVCLWLAEIVCSRDQQNEKGMPIAADLANSTMMSTSETTPLIFPAPTAAAAAADGHTRTFTKERTFRHDVFAFLEAKSPSGRVYERFTAILIVVNVLAFVLATLFVEEYNSDAPWAVRGVVCGNLCDALWFGNYKDNGLQMLGMGTTSILEVVTVFIFSVDYVCRLWTADLEDSKFEGGLGRLRYLPTFYSIVDLASTVPFYVDAFILTKSDLVASQVSRSCCFCGVLCRDMSYRGNKTHFSDNSDSNNDS